MARRLVAHLLICGCALFAMVELAACSAPAVSTKGSPNFGPVPERIAAFGNSDGDFQMLEYSTAGPGRRFGLIVHHTDADREWAYDRGSPIGKLERGLDEAASRGWVLADIKRDWRVIYPAN